jgi:hypothetical protein
MDSVDQRKTFPGWIDSLTNLLLKLPGFFAISHCSSLGGSASQTRLGAARKRIFTCAAHDALGHIHDRTSVIIPKDLQDRWLDPTMTDRNQVQHFIDTVLEPNLIPRIVGKEVGSVRNDGPQLITPSPGPR